ncbi:type II secretion system protein [Peribacillus saganii]|uniref:Type II secretion system protein n=1 Tax=Peribacillus saganii TaxID=2303992 RepID=A0A372LKE3_9BACI|nr:type II secretion system protein [Peribacillus saganii]RFU67119.1 type II secretion system protein [Peribacillus saganii]
MDTTNGNCKEFRNAGFSMIEVLLVITILAIISSIAVLSLISSIEKAKTDVCNLNTKQVEKMYNTYLLFENDSKHSEALFAQYLQEYGEEICPIDGEILYIDGKVQCSLHSGNGDNGEDDDDEDKGEGESVPYL